MTAIERLREIQQDLWRLGKASSVAEKHLLDAYGDAWPSRASQDLYTAKVADAQRHRRDSSKIKCARLNLDDGRDLIDALRYLRALEPMRHGLTDHEVRSFDLIANIAVHSEADRYRPGDEERVRRWIDRILANVEIGDRARRGTPAPEAVTNAEITDAPTSSRRPPARRVSSYFDADRAAGQPRHESEEEEQARLRRHAEDRRRWRLRTSGGAAEPPTSAASNATPRTESHVRPQARSASIPASAPLTKTEQGLRDQVRARFGQSAQPPEGLRGESATAPVRRVIVDGSDRYAEIKERYAAHKRYKVELARWKALPWLKRQLVQRPQPPRSS